MANQQSGSGILTPKQREYLRGISDIESGSSAERAMRSRIRQRVRDSILDFRLLFGSLEDRDREDVFEEVEIDNAISSVIAFLFLGATDNGYSHKTDEEVFSHFVKEGIQRTLNKRGEGVEDITVEIEIDRLDLEPLKEQDISQLSLKEVEQLFQAGKITPEEFGEIVQEHGRSIIWGGEE